MAMANGKWKMKNVKMGPVSGSNCEKYIAGISPGHNCNGKFKKLK
jgi:hypothetical protein